MEDVAAPQPAVLSHYDTDMDGQISTKEFERGLDDDVSFEEALLAHIQADLNGKSLELIHCIKMFSKHDKTNTVTFLNRQLRRTIIILQGNGL